MDCGEMLDLSLNEVEMIAMKAARGAGHAWGVAEDLGRSARWLAERGVDWSGSLLASLADPVCAAGLSGGPLLGLALADALDGAAEDYEAVFAQVRHAEWLLPPVALAAATRGITIAGGLGSWRFLCAGSRLITPSAIPATGMAPVDVTLTRAPADLPGNIAPDAPPQGRSRIPLSQHAALEAYVYRTYVPASEKSRLRGADMPRRTDG